MRVSSWGRLTSDVHQVCMLSDPGQALRLVVNSSSKGIAYGMGRSYGDVCLNPGRELWVTTGLDRFIAFDISTGRLICEAGVLLRDIQRLIIPHGWILPVSPGTQLVTVGGAIANDVHGKNHHVHGTFGDHVQGIKLFRTNGDVIHCGPDREVDWFVATVGGLGLTGLIIEVEIQLQRIAGPWLSKETIPYTRLGEFFSLADSSEADWEHTVSWVDCLSGANGRGIFMRGNHVSEGGSHEPNHRKVIMPFVPPVSLVNKLSLKSFNAIYYNINKFKSGRSLVHYEPFFYPLDNLLQWNRIYGPKGFYQYQSVIPREAGEDATKAMLMEINKSGGGSFLAVLKTFGNRQSLGMLSFPRPGVTLALDFPNHGDRTHRLFSRLDAIVRDAGGRIYPAKDARMPRELFEAGYPRINDFIKYHDPGISSALSRRLLGT